MVRRSWPCFNPDDAPRHGEVLPENRVIVPGSMPFAGAVFDKVAWAIKSPKNPGDLEGECPEIQVNFGKVLSVDNENG